MCCMGLPVQAAGTTPAPAKPTPSNSSKAGFKAIAPAASAPSTSVAQQSPQTSSSQEKTVKTVRNEKHTDSLASSLVSKTSPTTTEPVKIDSHPDRTKSGGRLARLTAYWASEGDYYTGRGISATGVRLHDGHCAVDPSIIPYGSVVEIAGVGKYLAVDTGSAVVSREAAKESGHTSAERGALVIDIFFESSREGEKFAASATKYASISWYTPSASSGEAKEARRLFADEDWDKIHSKQL